MPPDVFAQNILSCTLCDFPALIMARSNFLYQNCAHKSLHHSFNCEHFHALLFDTSSPEIHNVCMFYYCLWCISSLIWSLSRLFLSSFNSYDFSIHIPVFPLFFRILMLIIKSAKLWPGPCRKLLILWPQQQPRYFNEDNTECIRHASVHESSCAGDVGRGLWHIRCFYLSIYLVISFTNAFLVQYTSLHIIKVLK